MKAGKSSQWLKSQTANLWQYVPSGGYYMRAKIRGKLKVKSLDTTDLAMARRLLPKVLEKFRQKQAEPLASRISKSHEAQEIYLGRLKANNGIKDSTKHYRRETTARRAWREARGG